jgi:UDP:flavonoid glycosyltransferase YjiC (YdhE family)
LLRDLVASGIDLCVTTGLLASAADFAIASDHVAFAGFTPLDELLRDVDAVLTHGGAGTTLGSLAKGIPLVIAPQGADQFVQADRVSAARAGISVAPAESGPVLDAVRSVLGDPAFRDNAQTIAAQITALPSPADVASHLAAALED